MAKKSIFNLKNIMAADHLCLHLYVALLFAWVLAYGVVYGINTPDVGAVKGVMGEVAYLFTNPHGLLGLMIYVSPLVVYHFLGGKKSQIFYYLPLVWTVYDATSQVTDMHPFVTFWVMMLVSLYASVKIAGYAKD